MRGTAEGRKKAGARIVKGERKQTYRLDKTKGLLVQLGSDLLAHHGWVGRNTHKLQMLAFASVRSYSLQIWAYQVLLHTLGYLSGKAWQERHPVVEETRRRVVIMPRRPRRRETGYGKR